MSMGSQAQEMKKLGYREEGECRKSEEVWAINQVRKYRKQVTFSKEI